LFSFNAAQIPVYIAFVAGSSGSRACGCSYYRGRAPRASDLCQARARYEIFWWLLNLPPLRLNQAGVIPIIFALSFLLLPQMFANVFPKHLRIIWLAVIAQHILSVLKNLTIYGSLYFVFVVLFTYFYTAVTFDPHAIAENLQKKWCIYPRCAPGGSTSEYLAKVITRITLVGALFLGIIAVLPIIMQSFTGNPKRSARRHRTPHCGVSDPRSSTPRRRANLNPRILIRGTIVVYC